MSLPTIFLVDDHLIFRDSLKLLITHEKLGTVVNEASNGKEFLEKLEKDQPDLVIMDIDMPEIDGVEATRLALDKYPQLKILVLSMFGDEKYYFQMVNYGVKGFLLKTSDVKEFEQAIKQLVSGENFFSNELLRKIIVTYGKNPLSKEKTNTQLTAREKEILKYICNGFTNAEIAEKVHISPKTVKGHRTNLLAKTNSKNTPGMVLYAIKNKIIEV